MSEAKHTPGPWTYEKSGTIYDGNADEVCQMMTVDQWTCDLVASAPDLLAERDALRASNAAQESELVTARRVVDKLRATQAELVKAMNKISELDPHDAHDGFNEWGEAEMFNKAQAIARAELAKVSKS